MSYTEHYPSYSIVDGDVKVNIRFDPLSKAFEEAQKDLDRKVMQDMIPYMPMVTGTFVDLTLAISNELVGTGWVCAGAPPMGRFLYEGDVMVGETSGSPWAMLGEKKVTTGRPITYTTTFHPQATDHWFDKAKADHIKEWVALAKNKLGGHNG